MSFSRSQMRYMNPYDVHKAIINDYVLKGPTDHRKIFQRDTSKDRTDHDVLRDNHRFLWDDTAPTDTWEAQFAKKYYDKLFKEYCITDLTYYKENKIALRWRVEKELVLGKGQFICGSKGCDEKEGLRTWEVNFAYRELGEKKNALVKIRLCPDCSAKLNYRTKKREVKRLKSKRKSKGHSSRSVSDTSDETNHEEKVVEGPTPQPQESESPWDKHKPVETRSRDEEMEDYLQDLLL